MVLNKRTYTQLLSGISPQSGSVATLADQSQDRNEYVDDIQVEVDAAQHPVVNVLIIAANTVRVVHLQPSRTLSQIAPGGPVVSYGMDMVTRVCL
jgi:hypothetical protein